MRSKAEQLLYLRLNGFEKYILPLQIFSSREIAQDNDLTNKVGTFINSIPSELYAVRSSAYDEDKEYSNAGKFKSELNVPKNKIENALKSVVKSFNRSHQEDQVFVQPMLADSICSGVLFTKDSNTGSDYFVINVNWGPNTSAITSGAANGDLFVVERQAKFRSNYLSQIGFSELIEVAEKIIDKLDCDSLDIEFALTETGVYLFQIRELKIGLPKISSLELNLHLNTLRQKVINVMLKNPFLVGDSNCLGVMPDWNPAELIGLKPKQLALSLFKDLVTDSIWAYERSNLGYRNVRGIPLLIDLMGQPYIDVRASLNSLIPKDVENSTAEKLCNNYLNNLIANPNLHDKIESQVAIPNFVFNIENKLDLLADNFSNLEKNQFKKSLLKLTKNIIEQNPYGLANVLQKNKPLTSRYHAIINSDLDNLSKIYELLEDCRRYGTLPFSGVARMAFISTTMLESLVEIDVLDLEDLSNFWRSIPSVTSEMVQDFSTSTLDTFLSTYGHLRPGTFDIRVPTYSSDPDRYFKSITRFAPSSFDKGEIISIVKAKIESSKEFSILQISSTKFISFVLSSIQMRERIKFDFTRNISKILDLISIIGKEMEFSNDQLAYANIQTFIQAQRSSLNLKKFLLNDIRYGEEISMISDSMWLPPLITNENDVGCFKVPKSTPNFISKQCLTAKPLFISPGSTTLTNFIVVIESADPGYDWIFAQSIAGLITCYGGANSHMAVRCRELNIPAAIGVGVELFNSIKNSNLVYLDCANKKIEVHL
jgi:hypothetical protein